jgi:hypothetical protein
MGDPTRSYTTAGIALRVSGALKPHHHNKVETPLVGKMINQRIKIFLAVGVFIFSIYLKECHSSQISGPHCSVGKSVIRLTHYVESFETCHVLKR